MPLSDNRVLALELWGRTVEKHPTRVRIPVTDMIPIAVALLREVGQYSTSAASFIARAAPVLAKEELVDLPVGRAKWDRSYNPPLPAFLANRAVAGAAKAPAHKVEYPWHEALAFLAGGEQLRRAEDWMAIDRWLKEHGHEDDMASMRERSFQIFRDDKRLENVVTFKAFRDGLFDVARLRIERAPEPLVARFYPAAGSGRALLVENKDTFRSACVVNRKLLAFDCIIFGGGGAASGRMEDVSTLLDQVPFTALHYFGDLDAEGLRIARRTAIALEDTESGVSFHLAMPLYERLLEKPDIKEFGGPLDDALRDFLEGHRAAHLDLGLTGRGRIPQEALMRRDLIQILGTAEQEPNASVS